MFDSVPKRPTPPLPVGRWRTSGWSGNVLEAAAIDGQRTVDDFLHAAFGRLSQAR